MSGLVRWSCGCVGLRLEDMPEAQQNTVLVSCAGDGELCFNDNPPSLARKVMTPLADGAAHAFMRWLVEMACDGQRLRRVKRVLQAPITRSEQPYISSVGELLE